jgi:hypothetical protein
MRPHCAAAVAFAATTVDWPHILLLLRIIRRRLLPPRTVMLFGGRCGCRLHPLMPQPFKVFKGGLHRSNFHVNTVDTVLWLWLLLLLLVLLRRL